MNKPTFEDVMVLTDTISNRHMLQLDEARAMYDALCHLPIGAIVVEVGCDRGRSSSLIFQMAPAKDFLTIHVDPWHKEFDAGTQATKAKEWMEVMCERCEYQPFILLRMTTEEAAPFIRQITPDGINFAFIDGSHDEPDVLADMEIVATRVRTGGFLAVHDYPSGGVTEVVDAFIARGGWTKHNQASGLGVWRRN